MGLEEGLFEISDKVSDETSLSYAFMTGSLPSGKYKFEIFGVPYEVNVKENCSGMELRRLK